VATTSFKKLHPMTSKCSDNWLHRAMFVLITSVCLAFSGADIEFDFVLMNSAYSKYLKDSCKQHLALNWKLIQYLGVPW